MALPIGNDWRYEPKLDGFRALVFFDGEGVHLDSRNGNSLDAYFPDLVQALPTELGHPCVLDGELVIGANGGLDFGGLQARLSRHKVERPIAGASFVAFDLLSWRDQTMLARPFSERRHMLERHIAPSNLLAITPQTRNGNAAQAWLSFTAEGIEGVVAKRASLPYRPGQRLMIKVRRLRTIDCVVGGFVPDGFGKPSSLVLGLYDGCGILHHVGNTSVLRADDRVDAAGRLRQHVGKPSFGDGRMPGFGRWPGQRDLIWCPVAPSLVCEVAGGNIDAGRFRHSLRFIRWREDRDPWDCRTGQLR